jgi:hypothetical protein
MLSLLDRPTAEFALGVQSQLWDYYRCAADREFWRTANCNELIGVTEFPDDLRYERYVDHSGWRVRVQKSWIRDLYYQLRPLLPLAIRKHLQRIYLRDWTAIQFPSWPVDRSADVLLENLLIVAMQAFETDRLPFIWFWPDGHRACAMLTHDVETTAGRDFSEHLMNIDDSFGMKSSFQIVPEERYAVPSS